MLDDVFERVEKRLEAVKLSPTAASRKAGLSADAIRNMKRAIDEGRSRQGVSTATLTALAPVLQTTAGWLLDGTGEEATTAFVEIVGYVGAGAVATLFEYGQGGLGRVEPPRDRTPETVAVEVRGTSLGPVFDNALIFYDDVRSPVTPDLHGRLCVVGLPDGRVLVKKLQSNGSGRFHLLSNGVDDPLLDEDVAWAAKVKEIRPR